MIYTAALSKPGSPKGSGFAWPVGVPMQQFGATYGKNVYDHARDIDAGAYFNPTGFDHRALAADIKKNTFTCTPGSVAKTRSKVFLERAAAAAKERSDGIAKIRATLPTRTVGIYLEGALAGPNVLWPKERGGVEDWAKDNARLAVLGLDGGADWVGTGAYIPSSVLTWLTPGEARVYAELRIELLRQYQRPIKLFLSCYTAGDGLLIDPAYIRAMLGVCAAERVDAIVWNNHVSESDAALRLADYQ